MTRSEKTKFNRAEVAKLVELLQTKELATWIQGANKNKLDLLVKAVTQVVDAVDSISAKEKAIKEAQKELTTLKKGLGLS